MDCAPTEKRRETETAVVFWELGLVQRTRICIAEFKFKLQTGEILIYFIFFCEKMIYFTNLRSRILANFDFYYCYFDR